jgi:hypothetical protein
MHATCMQLLRLLELAHAPLNRLCCHHDATGRQANVVALRCYMFCLRVASQICVHRAINAKVCIYLVTGQATYISLLGILERGLSTVDLSLGGLKIVLVSTEGTSLCNALFLELGMARNHSNN